MWALAKKEKKEEHKRTIEQEKQKLISAKREEEAEEARRLERLKELKLKEPSHTTGGNAKFTAAAPKKEFIKIEEVEDEDNVGGSVANNALKDELPDHIDLNEPSRPSYGDAPSPIRYDDGSDDDDDESGCDPVDESFLPPDFRDSDDMDMDLDDHKPPSKSEAADIPPPEPAPVPLQPVKEEAAEPGWRSVQQLVQFRATSIAIADDFLKEKGIKLRMGRKTHWELKYAGEWQIYNEGREDAKKIDVKRKRIKGPDED